jgi:hypothetical protein
MRLQICSCGLRLRLCSGSWRHSRACRHRWRPSPAVRRRQFSGNDKAASWPARWTAEQVAPRCVRTACVSPLDPLQLDQLAAVGLAGAAPPGAQVAIFTNRQGECLAPEADRLAAL